MKHFTLPGSGVMVKVCQRPQEEPFGIVRDFDIDGNFNEMLKLLEEDSKENPPAWYVVSEHTERGLFHVWRRFSR